MRNVPRCSVARGAMIVGLCLSACGGESVEARAKELKAGMTPPAARGSAPAPSVDPDEHSIVGRAEVVGTYVSTPWGFSTTSYWLEGPDGLVAIDTQFLPSAAEEMIAAAEATTKKKFVLAIVLHANPDKFNGTATFQKHGVKVVTSAQVKAALPAIHEKRMRAFYDRYKPDYPSELPEPEVFGDKTTVIKAAGLTLKLHVLGAGCSEAHVVVERAAAGGGDLFAGDLVANGAHSWLEIGKTDAWLKRLAEMKKLKPAHVYPGRGLPGPATLLDDEKAYLEKVVSLVAAEKPTMPVREDAIERIEKATIAAYPTHTFPVFLKIGLPAEWERQARAAKK